MLIRLESQQGVMSLVLQLFMTHRRLLLSSNRRFEKHFCERSRRAAGWQQRCPSFREKLRGPIIRRLGNGNSV